MEDHCATRERFTFETAVRSWVEPGARPKTAVCFKDGCKVGASLAAGETIKKNIANKHDDIMVQTAEKGSYKVETLLEFLDWALPVAETRRSESVSCVCVGGVGSGIIRVPSSLAFFQAWGGYKRTYVRTSFRLGGGFDFVGFGYVRTYVRTYVHRFPSPWVAAEPSNGEYVRMYVRTHINPVSPQLRTAVSNRGETAGFGLRDARLVFCAPPRGCETAYCGGKGSLSSFSWWWRHRRSATQ